MDKRNEILRELVSCRGFLLRQLADLAEERGRIYEAAAWRYLEKYQLWPRYNLRRTHILWTYHKASFKKSRLVGSALLPHPLAINPWMDRSEWEAGQEEEALLEAVKGLTRWFENGCKWK